MPTKYIEKSTAPAASKTGSHAGIGVDIATNNLNFNPDGTKRVVMHQGQATLVETVTATNVLTAAESGKTCYLASATEFVTTLPAPAAGLEFEFVVAAAPASASYTVVTAGSADIMLGQVVSSAGGTGDSETSGGDTYTFVDGQAVVGDRARFTSDGTSWFVSGVAKVVAGATITGT